MLLIRYNKSSREDCAYRETVVGICALYPLALRFRQGQGYHMDYKTSPSDMQSEVQEAWMLTLA